MKRTFKASLCAVLTAFSVGVFAQGYQNPVISGFHPDPSVCRADSDYYLVNSSFEYFPGVPLFHSRDLVTWEQIGHVLTRKSQLTVKGGNVWGGIYAPTIRYNNGIYYMITTDVAKGNFFVYTDNPRGEWSEPIFLQQQGIDPSLYFEDGRCYMVSNPSDAIWLSEIDITTGKQLTESKIIWGGTGGRYPEGPHIYKRDGWYYLLISEGGTEYGHMITIARSRNIDGPYESNPANPILTHTGKNAQTNPIQGVGHADLVEAHDGSWWLVCLGFRPQSGCHHVMGRETFLAPVEWNAEGWPVVNGNGTIDIDMSHVKTLPQQGKKASIDWDFNNDRLGVEWNWIGNPVEKNYSLTERKGFLRVRTSDSSLSQMGVSPSFVGRRQEHIKFQATTKCEPHVDGRTGMTIYMSPTAHYDIYVRNSKVCVSYHVASLQHEKEVCNVDTGRIYFKVTGNNDLYTLLYSLDGSKYVEAAQFDTRLLSSETTGGFTGVYIGLFAEGKGYTDFDDFRYMELVEEVSPKLTKGHGNPLLDFIFTADPTCVEHNGRLYVYATNDHQQYEAVGRDGRNTYERINSLVMMSTDDMVNWTYHGLIETKKLAPWIIASWAPSIVKRVEDDGKTHFYLYFSNSGFGTGVLTATSPVGPWTSPLPKSLIDAETPGLGDCTVPFDPGAVIDSDGQGWLTVGAGKARIMKLGKDMISIDGSPVPLNTPHHFEANELNYINDTYVYTYNTDWKDYSDWTISDERPTICCMTYMTSKTPLVTDSWKYHHNYLKNPGDYGYDYSNNHTHLHKYMGKWYIFYHTMTLQHSFNSDGGFRNVCVDEIAVDTATLNISMGHQSLEGVKQIKHVNPLTWQQIETTFATQDIKFVPTSESGNMLAQPAKEKGMIILKGVEFKKTPRKFSIVAQGTGTVEVRCNSADGETTAVIDVQSDKTMTFTTPLSTQLSGVKDLYITLKGENLRVDKWTFTK